jgi:hypothetical protein
MLANVPQAKFSSRYADPNSAASSGSLVAFISGGHLVPAPNSRGIIGSLASAVKNKSAKTDQQGSNDLQSGSQGYGTQEDNQYSRNYRGGRRGRRGREPGQKSGGLVIGGVKKLLNQVCFVPFLTP